MIRVGYIAGEPNPSRAPHLDRIAERPEIELTVIYAASTVHRREWSLELRARADRAARSKPAGNAPPAPRLPAYAANLAAPRPRAIRRAGHRRLVATRDPAGDRVGAPTPACRTCSSRENHFREPRPRWIRALKSAVPPAARPPGRGTARHGHPGSRAPDGYGARPETITVFPNTVDIEASARESSELRVDREGTAARTRVAEDAVVVTQVSRFIPFKGAGRGHRSDGPGRESSRRPSCTSSSSGSGRCESISNGACRSSRSP